MRRRMAVNVRALTLQKVAVVAISKTGSMEKTTRCATEINTEEYTFSFVEAHRRLNEE